MLSLEPKVPLRKGSAAVQIRGMTRRGKSISVEPDIPEEEVKPHGWLTGWDPTPGIVSVWADAEGHATVWRRLPETGVLVREAVRFRPWLLLTTLDDLRHLGDDLVPAGSGTALHRRQVTWRELSGPGELRYLVRGHDLATLSHAVTKGASERLGRRVGHLRELGDAEVLSLPPEEQYLVATGRTYFRDLSFDQLHRLQFDLETTGLDATRDRIFMVAVRDPSGEVSLLEARSHDDAGEATLIRELVTHISRVDPDVIENHNLHGFDITLPGAARPATESPTRVRQDRTARAAHAWRHARDRERHRPDAAHSLPHPRARTHRHTRRRAPTRLLGARPAWAWTQGGGAALRPRPG